MTWREMCGLIDNVLKEEELDSPAQFWSGQVLYTIDDLFRCKSNQGFKITDEVYASTDLAGPEYEEDVSIKDLRAKAPKAKRKRRLRELYS